MLQRNVVLAILRSYPPDSAATVLDIADEIRKARDGTGIWISAADWSIRRTLARLIQCGYVVQCEPPWPQKPRWYRLAQANSP
jgi:hypothetical protein